MRNFILGNLQPRFLEGFRRLLAASGPLLGVSWALLDASLAVSGVLLAAFWLVLGVSWVHLGSQDLPHVDLRCFSEDLGRVS